MKCISILLMVQVIAASEAPLSSNAALDYWAAFSFLPEERKENDAVTDYHRGISPTRAVVVPANLRRMMLKAVSKTACEWGVDLAEGPGALLPYIAPARRTAQLLSASIALNPSNRAEHIITGITLGRHLQHDRVMIGQIIGLYIEQKISQACLRIINDLQEDERQQIVQALANLPAPPSPAAAFAAERSWGKWIRQKIDQTDAQTAMKVLFEDVIVAMGTNNAETRALFSTITNKQQALQAIAEYENKLTDLIQLAALPITERQAQLAAFDASIEDSKNVFIRILMPAVLPVTIPFDQQHVWNTVLTTSLKDGSQANLTKHLQTLSWITDSRLRAQPNPALVVTILSHEEPLIIELSAKKLQPAQSHTETNAEGF